MKLPLLDVKLNYHVLCITVAVLGIYLLALQAGFSPLDDVDTIKHVQSGSFSLYDLFLVSGRGYYRPLTMLSLLADFHLFGGNPAGYHLTNILLHLANSLLVYYLAKLIFAGKDGKNFYPFLAGILFAVHPVNCETVVWISARPDLLCCFFCLVCLILFIRKSCNASLVVYVYLFLFFLCSLMAKESSLFLPVLALCWFLLERKKVHLQNAVALTGSLILALFVYLSLRKGLPIPSVPVPSSPASPGGTLPDFIVDAAATYGFYVRKLLYPFPLNIAITEIDTALGIMVLLLVSVAAAVFWVKEALFRLPIVFLSLSLLPPLGALVLSLPWTPYAERYLYLPSVAFALCIALVARRFAGRLPRFALIGCVLVIAVPTAYRVRMWTQPILFWQDAVVKAPRFGTVHLILATQYLHAGRLKEAEQSLQQAIRLGFSRKSAQDFSLEIKRLLDAKKKAADLSQTNS